MYAIRSYYAARDAARAEAVLADLMTYLGDQYAAAMRHRAEAEAKKGPSR